MVVSLWAWPWGKCSVMSQSTIELEGVRVCAACDQGFGTCCPTFPKPTHTTTPSCSPSEHTPNPVPALSERAAAPAHGGWLPSSKGKGREGGNRRDHRKQRCRSRNAPRRNVVVGEAGESPACGRLTTERASHGSAGQQGPARSTLTYHCEQTGQWQGSPRKGT